MKKSFSKLRVSFCFAFLMAVFILSGSNRVWAGETPVNTYKTSNQRNPSVAVDADGDFVVTWESFGQGPGTIPLYDIYFQRFNSGGIKVGGEIGVTNTSWDQRNPAVAMDMVKEPPAWALIAMIPMQISAPKLSRTVAMEWTITVTVL